MQRGDGYAAHSQWREAVIEYFAALQIDPKRGDVRLKLSDAYLRMGDGDSALREAVGRPTSGPTTSLRS